MPAFFYKMLIMNQSEAIIEEHISKLSSSLPTSFSIKVNKPTFLQKILKKTVRNYEIKPLVINDYMRIASLIDTAKELFIPDEKGDFLVNDINGIVSYKKVINEIISIFIKEDEKFIGENLNIKEFHEMFLKIISVQNFNNFFFTFTTAMSQIQNRIPKRMTEKEKS